MSTTTSSGVDHSTRLAPVPVSAPLAEKVRDPGYQAFLILRAAFVAAPILFGIDKFFNWMTFWPNYLWVGFPHLFSVSPQTFMYGVGVIEMVAGLLVFHAPG